MKNKLLENRGLTLVELIIVVAILGIITSFMFTLFHFNYSTFFRSNKSYNIQTNLNEVLRAIEEELRFADGIIIYDNKAESEFDIEKNYIYIEENSIKLKKENSEGKNLTIKDMKVNSLSFQLDENLITIYINGESISSNKEINTQYTMELLNFNGNDTKGSVIAYYQIKGDDTH